MMIDVFICTYNPNLDYLRRTIVGVQNQDLNKELWDLTIIDNNSQVPVSSIDFVKDWNIKVIVERKQGLTAARRCATENAKGQILVFVDDDLVIAKDYLKNVLKVFSDSKIGIVSGNILPEYSSIPGRWFTRFEGMIAIRRFSSNDLFLQNNDLKFNVLFPIGAGMCIRYDIILDYYTLHLSNNNYIEGRKGDELSSSEDLDLDFYALSKGFTIGVSPQLNSVHLIPNSRIKIEYLKKLSYYTLKSNFQLNLKWKTHFQKDVFDFFEVTYLAIFYRLVFHGILSFEKSHYLRFQYFKNLLEYKKTF